jgi:hypothetical protein
VWSGQLPVDIDGFTGREQELAGLEALLGDGDDEGVGEPVVVSAVVGTAGAGKSALADPCRAPAGRAVP